MKNENADYHLPLKRGDDYVELWRDKGLWDYLNMDESAISEISLAFARGFVAGQQEKIKELNAKKNKMKKMQKITQKIKRVWLTLEYIYSPNPRMREKAGRILYEPGYGKIKTRPTGVCWGCGKIMYNGEDICSESCSEIVEFQLCGYE